MGVQPAADGKGIVVVLKKRAGKHLNGVSHSIHFFVTHIYKLLTKMTFAIAATPPRKDGNGVENCLYV